MQVKDAREVNWTAGDNASADALFFRDEQLFHIPHRRDGQAGLAAEKGPGSPRRACLERKSAHVLPFREKPSCGNGSA